MKEPHHDDDDENEKMYKTNLLKACVKKSVQSVWTVGYRKETKGERPF
jgi:hypothetical protein